MLCRHQITTTTVRHPQSTKQNLGKKKLTQLTLSLGLQRKSVLFSWKIQQDFLSAVKLPYSDCLSLVGHFSSHNPLLCLLLGKPGQSKALKRWVIGGRMNQLPLWWLKPSLQTAESLSHRLVAQREASAGGLTLQQTGTRANTAGGYDPTRGGSNTIIWTS